MNKIRVMLVEDDPFWQQTLAADLNEEEDIEVNHIASTKEEALLKGSSGEIDVVLMDINLTENRLDGLEATRELALSDLNDLKIIMLTSLQDRDVIVKSFQHGANNFITKSNYKDIVQAIRDAYAGKPSIHSDAAPILVKEIQLNQLTPAEREIYDLKEKGMNKTQISEALNKSVSTIKTQIKSIKNKLMKKGR
ncbi:response regulator transcription factor [Paenibacillus sedimenti]|uniref:Response regulator transcription factor n=1 Tax=Paenibacillus sedimenti TaxID=2770274 RepID=A0A926QHW9_9BACL|nr:response regulator transcription factor [Paenibacillus sedimenti]MBD0379930.1 response regulator transcription factor [Paenibacillus sedimenti]